ncbi:hypothetical protein RHGRI_017870 [Rhododendron griersonianum]|uniref:SUI1 domain-containing protein n=31 Tax=Ericaceae TaxID=4345 RepID=A0AAV6JZE8_9ERIC|nr:hypothetical protein RHGRI_017870 [Rhododendron griersonianum]
MDMSDNLEVNLSMWNLKVNVARLRSSCLVLLWSQITYRYSNSSVITISSSEGSPPVGFARPDLYRLRVVEFCLPSVSALIILKFDYDQKRRSTARTLLFRTTFMSELPLPLPLPPFDPFADANAEDSSAGTKEYVHVRVQQRNGRKSLTTVQGLKKDFSYNKILKDLKKEFCCNGTVVQDPELGQVIQLQGDQRKNVSTFLVQAGIVKKENVKIHGF